MYIGELSAGEAYEIAFSADPNNQGATGIGRGWLGKPGTAVPQNVLEFVAPGAAAVIDTGVVPTGVKALQIDVHPPAGGKGTLQVTQGGTQYSSPPVSGETTWVFAII
jgi:hypothetical protein